MFFSDIISSHFGQLAQLVEPLVYTQVVGSSSLSLPILPRLSFSWVFFLFSDLFVDSIIKRLFKTKKSTSKN